MRKARRQALCAALVALLLVVANGVRSSRADVGATPGEARSGPHHRPRLERMLERYADRLKLDDATQARIRSIADASRAEGRKIHDQLRALHAEMQKLLLQDQPDEAAVMRQAERIGAVQTEAQKHRLRTMLQIRALLTPEQRQEMVKVYQEMEPQRRRRFAGSPVESPNPQSSASPSPSSPLK